MNSIEDLENHLISYTRYYTIKKEDVSPPFYAEAEFVSHTEHYILVRAAHVSDVDSNEFVYFYATENLTLENLITLSETAWTTGLSKFTPKQGHRNSDVTLVIFADSIEENVYKQVKKIKKYKSYKHTFWGWSHFRLVVKNSSTQKIYCNNQGSNLKKIFR